MKAIKIVTILIFVYLAIIVTFESLLGFFQPADQSTLVITTTDRKGVANDRVVARQVLHLGTELRATEHTGQQPAEQRVDAVADDSVVQQHPVAPARPQSQQRQDRASRNELAEEAHWRKSSPDSSTRTRCGRLARLETFGG